MVGYLVYRHNTYDPPTLTKLAQLATEASIPTPPTTPAGLPLTGPLQTSTLPPSTIVSPSAYASSTAASSAASNGYGARLRHAVNVIRTPARFYAINLFASAAVAGVGMSLGQRMLCGTSASKKIEEKR